MFRLTLEEGYSLSTMLTVAAVSLLLAGVFYWRAFRTLSRKRWQVLLALRAVAIVIVVLLLFGNRLPSVMRSLGRGVTEFKKGIEGGGDDDEAPKAEKKPEGEKK